MKKLIFLLILISSSCSPSIPQMRDYGYTTEEILVEEELNTKIKHPIAPSHFLVISLFGFVMATYVDYAIDKRKATPWKR